MSDNFKFKKKGKWPGLFKVMEEMNELGVELSKLAMVDGDPKAYWTGRDLTGNIEDELGDLTAIIDFFIDENAKVGLLNKKKIEARKKKKTKRYHDWYD
jgi:hypothetical protein